MLTTKILAIGGVSAALSYAQNAGDAIATEEQLVLEFGNGARTVHAPGALMHPGCMFTIVFGWRISPY